ncbi:hypothetical protein [Arthrobacter bambusae]|uniref:Uncharacterized protein n=1 Tax=Arthrobacter bambusae TaxID=1338426 RepID=A0AAW8DGH2_9MICC|nr:hypothetical protein [Arthrobacter bambusae]MDP9904561.1 hypothetical protein [Arthrobacter bambusae]MDQ0129376.1 hypothetical protein [Arthrobacter bambusae]MDQ0181011.1 hypothetical protein [Arthrobacter bambusae]
MSAIEHFLLVFDHRSNRLVEQKSFGSDVHAATKAYGEMEREYKDCHAIDIVLVGSDSIETVKVTHANYFTGESVKMVQNALSVFPVAH